MMWCGRCNNDVMACECEDLNERMRTASDSQYVALKWCRGCDSYYAKCDCEFPDFVIRTDGQYIDNPDIIDRFA